MVPVTVQDLIEYEWWPFEYPVSIKEVRTGDKVYVGDGEWKVVVSVRENVGYGYCLCLEFSDSTWSFASLPDFRIMRPYIVGDWR